MKYLFMINTMNVGGAETGLVELINRLIDNGNQVDLLLTYKTGNLLTKINKKVKIISLVDRKKIFSSIKGIIVFAFTLLGIGNFYRWIVKDSYDVEIAYLEGFPTLFISKSKSSTTKIASVRVDITDHSTILDKLPNGYRMQYEAYGKFDVVHCVSDAVKTSFDLKYPNLSDKSLTITTGFDYESIRSKAKLFVPDFDKNSINVVIVGRMEEQKGYSKLFEAIQNNDISRSIKFNIVGNATTEYAKKLLNTYSNLIENGRIHIIGQVSNPYPYIYNSDVLLSCSDYEGYPRAILEALILGIPVYATDIPSNREALQNGELGVLYENSSIALASVLEDVKKKTSLDYSFKNINSLDDFIVKLDSLIKKEEII